MTAAISADGVRKRYGDVQAVDGVSLNVEVGEFYGILGPNGAGKTTTLEILEGIREPDEGRVELLGLNPWPRNSKLLPRIGVQFQASAFFNRLTARETIRTFGSFYGVGARTADAMLERVGLAESAGIRTEKLSGGQAQRLSIACALAHDPELVFLDEPTTGLDPQARRNLWDLLRDINAEGRTVVLTTHYLDEAELLCDRVSVMDHGKVLRTGAPATLIREIDDTVRISVESGLLPVDTARDLFAAAGADINALDDDGVSLAVSTRLPAPVLSVLAEQNALRGLEVRGATLEDVFLQLTGREYRA
ncbi:ABC transporter ATP-binding protein [Kitasatospora sp. NPDC059571]|uniref:ABC transporter ATP-binding protein n=1 Tax=Kitasatospora sp. NPDC059571 TaxID=3346871 RepID=UPI0036AAB3A7